MTNWYNKNPDIDIRFINLPDFVRQVEKELVSKTGSTITIGVQERPYFIPKKGSGRREMGDNVRTTTSTSLIAAGHEFGNSRQPRRSFLELSARRFVKSNLQQIADRNYKYVKSFLKALTTKIYDTIIDCFLTSGWGTWKKLSKKYMEKTGRTNPPLIDTGQLMSAIYAQYEGFTVSGKQVGGFMQSDFYNIEDSTPKSKQELKQEAVKFREKILQMRSIKQKAEQAKAQIEMSREEVVEKLYARKKKELGHIGFMSWLGDEEMEIDAMTTEEIRKRYGI